MANTIDLTTLSEVQAYLAQSVLVSGSNPIISSLITSVSEQCIKYTGRIFSGTTFTETYNGTGSQDLLLRNYPVQSVSGVSIFGYPIHQTTSSNGYVTGWNFDQDGVHLTNRTFPKGFQNIYVTYRAGYDTIPYDINRSVAEYVAIIFQKRSRIGEVSQSIPEVGTVSYINDRDGVPASIINVWDKYTRTLYY